MFTAYFDASGKEERSNRVIVAGFISSTKGWGEISEKWKIRLNREGVNYFRAADAQSREGECRTAWKNLSNDAWHAKREQLWNDLLDILEPSIYRKFAYMISLDKDSKPLTAEIRKSRKINAYVLCAIKCALAAHQWALKQQFKTVEYVLEEGDEGWGNLVKWFAFEGLPEPIRKNKCDQMKEGISHPAVVPLQCADFLAHELFQAEKIRDRKQSINRGRPFFRFLHMEGEFKVLPVQSLESVAEWIKGSFPYREGRLWRYL